jgi:hypothetical protein
MHRNATADIGSPDVYSDGVGTDRNDFAAVQQIRCHLVCILERKAVLTCQHGHGLIDDLRTDNGDSLEDRYGPGRLLSVSTLRIDDDIRVSEGTHDRRAPRENLPAA